MVAVWVLILEVEQHSVPLSGTDDFPSRVASLVASFTHHDFPPQIIPRFILGTRLSRVVYNPAHWVAVWQLGLDVDSEITEVNILAEDILI